jgi:hypothetical protein
MKIVWNPKSMAAVMAYIKTIPRGAVKAGFKAFVDYLVGNKQHGFRHDEPQKYVSRAKAGYKTSAAQMRFFFATGILTRDNSGKITLHHYKRSGETAAAWKAEPRRNGYEYKIVNPKEGAYWTRGDPGRTRQHQLAGRRNMSEVVAANFMGATRHMVAEVKKYLKNK